MNSRTQGGHYFCHICDNFGVKLWRTRNTDKLQLLCKGCAEKYENVDPVNMNSKGAHKGEFGKTNRIGDRLVPALPANEEVSEFYSWDSAPKATKNWWEKLRNTPKG